VPGAIAVHDRLLFIGRSEGTGRIEVFDRARGSVVRSFRFSDPESSFGSVAGLALDGTWHLFVADPVNNAVRKLNAFGREVACFGRRSNGIGRAPDRRGYLSAAQDVALDGDGNLYVACGAEPLVHGVQKLAPDGRCVGAFSAFGEPNERFGAPRGIAVQGERVYVADTLGECVQVFTRAGVFISMFSTATSPAERSFPTAVVPRSTGGILVAQRGPVPGVKLFDGNGEFVRWWIEGGEGEDEIEDPEDVADGGSGELLVLDRGRVLVFDGDGRFKERLLDDEATRG
jgi:DNA-binding beta-propeller fold protein YncE